MKKLIVTAFAVCTVALVQAASVDWNSGALTYSSGADITAEGQLTGYLWEISFDTYNSYVSKGSKDLSQSVGIEFEAGKLGQALATDVNSYSTRGGATLNLTGADTWGAGDTAYALLLYVDTIGSEETMYLANVAAVTFESEQPTSVADLANIRGGSEGSGATAWAAAPEPTSGLLVLMGLAGLMLRRKRA